MTFLNRIHTDLREFLNKKKLTELFIVFIIKFAWHFKLQKLLLIALLTEPKWIYWNGTLYKKLVLFKKKLAKNE